jgi:hypothetical protein
MSERDQDRDRKLGSSDLEPGEDELDEELEAGPEEEEALEEFEPESREVEAGPSRGRFGFVRPEREAEESGRRVTGSVRESHERIHVDDRLSALFAVLAAGVLLLVLAMSVIANYVPQPTSPTLAPLVVPTAQVAPSTSPAARATAAPTATLAAFPTPSATK